MTDDGVLLVDPGFDAAAGDFCDELAGYLTVLRGPIERTHSHMCERDANFARWQRAAPRPNPFAIRKELRDNYYVRSFGGAEAWTAPEGELRRHHLMAAARTLARFDVVMTVETLARDAPAQMHRVGLPGFRVRHAYERSRAENLKRATREPSQRIAGRAACEVPPTAAELDRLVAACKWDSILYEFARLIAARRTAAGAAYLRRTVVSSDSTPGPGPSYPGTPGG